ncbi:MAG: putative monovalent cation/H+ antiporter subunit A [Calditrichaeota bacterium]|nr:putative monovalent cation/H+ antiporter subunit A [Calditrichota bacterium]
MFSIYLMLIFFLLTPLVSPLFKFFKEKANWVLAVFPALFFISMMMMIPTIQYGPKIISLQWVPSIGVNLDFVFDGLSILFALLVSGIGILIFIYAGSYLKNHPLISRFYVFLFIFMASMLGLVLSDNIILLFIFWEATSISSYLLIGFDHENPEARKAALKALLITGLGGLSLMAGLILLGSITGSYTISGMNPVTANSPLYGLTLFLILLGAFTKSAQFPFHFWLPGAMKAPTPVSAYLHSATMVKAGVFLLMRLNPILGGTADWHLWVTLAGTTTMLTGSVLTLGQKDMKGLLASTTIIALGILVTLIGLSTSLAAKAALVFLLVHSLYKGSLFLVVGIIDHETGTRDITKLHSLTWVLPFSAFSAVLAAFSMSGFPPLLGFISKELLYEAKIQAPSAGEIILITGFLANAVNVTVAALIAIKPFLGRKKKISHHIHEVPFSLWLAPFLMAVAGLLFGFFSDSLGRLIISPALAVIHAEPTVVKLKMWHGVNEVFLLSVITVLTGIIFYFLYPQFIRMAGKLSRLRRFSISTIYERFLTGFQKFSYRVTVFLQNGRLRYYLMSVLIAMILLVLLFIFPFSEIEWKLEITDIYFFDLALVVLILIAAALVLFTSSRLTAIVALGIIGYGVALIYALYGAPDLAITQLLIETLIVILFALVIFRLPNFRSFSGKLTRWRDAFIALASGAVVTILTLKAGSLQFHPNISGYFLEKSYREAYGKNVVNVILVDFRALDTLGEITVLTVAAIGVFALLKLKRKQK